MNIYYLKMTSIAALIIFILSYEIGQAQWKKVNDGLFGSVIDIKENKIFVGTSKGIYLSTNNGDDWIPKNNDLGNPDEYEGLRILSLVVYENTIVAGTLYGIFISEDNGENWSERNKGLPDGCEIKSLAFQNNLIFAGTNNGLFQSSDNCKHWVKQDNYPWISVESVVANKDHIIATNGIEIFHSTDLGINWNSIGKELSYPDNISFNNNDIIVGTRYNGIFFSSDNGKTWQGKNKGLNELYITSITTSGNKLFVGTSRKGIFFSSDNGNSWTANNDSLSDLEIKLTAADDKYFYVVTEMGRIFRANLNDFVDNNVTIYGNGFVSEGDTSLYRTTNNDKCQITWSTLNGKILSPVTDSVVKIIWQTQSKGKLFLKKIYLPKNKLDTSSIDIAIKIKKNINIGIVIQLFTQKDCEFYYSSFLTNDSILLKFKNNFDYNKGIYGFINDDNKQIYGLVNNDKENLKKFQTSLIKELPSGYILQNDSQKTDFIIYYTKRIFDSTKTISKITYSPGTLERQEAYETKNSVGQIVGRIRTIPSKSAEYIHDDKKFNTRYLKEYISILKTENTNIREEIHEVHLIDLNGDNETLVHEKETIDYLNSLDYITRIIGTKVKELIIAKWGIMK